MNFNAWFDRRAGGGEGDGLEGPEGSPEASAIVVGYGRFGQTVAQMLMAKGIAVTLIDSKPDQIERSGAFGMKVYYGDGTRLDLLRAAGARSEEHTSELQSLMRISYAVFCLKKKKDVKEYTQ